MIAMVPRTVRTSHMIDVKFDAAAFMLSAFRLDLMQMMICLQQTRAHLPIAAVMFDDHTNDATILYTAHHPFTSPPLDNTHSALIPTHSTGDMVFVKNNNTESYKKSFHPTYFAIGNFYYYFFFFISSICG